MDDATKPLILVDSTNFSFKRATALISWWRQVNRDEPKTNNLPWVLNPVYLTKYTELYKRYINDLAKKFGTAPKNILFARDWPRDHVWRKEIFPEYKANRDKSDPCNTNDIGISSVEIDKVQLDTSKWSKSWEHLHNQIISVDSLGVGPIMKHNNDTFLNTGYVQLMRIEKAEADDICAVIAMKVRNLQPTRRIVIVSNDKDYLQLEDKFLTIVDLPKFEPIKKSNLTAQQELFFKIIGGDPSDNIPSCGFHGAENLARAGEAEIEKVKAQDPKFARLYERNKQIIDFRCIPQEIQDAIWNKFLDIAPGFKLLSPATTNTISTPTLAPTLAVKTPIKKPIITLKVPTILPRQIISATATDTKT